MTSWTTASEVAALCRRALLGMASTEAERASGEAELRRLQCDAVNFGDCLSELVAAEQSDSGLRLAASVLLTRAVEAHWHASDGACFGDKPRVVSSLLHVLHTGGPAGSDVVSEAAATTAENAPSVFRTASPLSRPIVRAVLRSLRAMCVAEMPVSTWMGLLDQCAAEIAGMAAAALGALSSDVSLRATWRTDLMVSLASAASRNAALWAWLAAAAPRLLPPHFAAAGIAAVSSSAAVVAALRIAARIAAARPPRTSREAALSVAFTDEAAALLHRVGPADVAPSGAADGGRHARRCAAVVALCHGLLRRADPERYGAPLVTHLVGILRWLAASSASTVPSGQTPPIAGAASTPLTTQPLFLFQWEALIADTATQTRDDDKDAADRADAAIFGDGDGTDDSGLATRGGGGGGVLPSVLQALPLALLETWQFLLGVWPAAFTLVAPQDALPLLAWAAPPPPESPEALLSEITDDGCVLAGCAAGTAGDVSSSILQLYIEYDHGSALPMANSWLQLWWGVQNQPRPGAGADSAAALRKAEALAALAAVAWAIVRQCDVSGVSFVSLLGADGAQRFLEAVAAGLSDTDEKAVLGSFVGVSSTSTDGAALTEAFVYARSRCALLMAAALKLSRHGAVRLCVTAFALLSAVAVGENSETLAEAQSGVAGAEGVAMMSVPSVVAALAATRVLSGSPDACDALSESVTSLFVGRLLAAASGRCFVARRHRDSGGSADALARLAVFCGLSGLATVVAVAPEAVAWLLAPANVALPVALAAAVPRCSIAPLVTRLSLLLRELLSEHSDVAGGCVSWQQIIDEALLGPLASSTTSGFHSGEAVPNGPEHPAAAALLDVASAMASALLAGGDKSRCVCASSAAGRRLFGFAVARAASVADDPMAADGSLRAAACALGAIAGTAVLSGGDDGGEITALRRAAMALVWRASGGTNNGSLETTPNDRRPNALTFAAVATALGLVCVRAPSGLAAPEALIAYGRIVLRVAAATTNAVKQQPSSSVPEECDINDSFGDGGSSSRCSTPAVAAGVDSWDPHVAAALLPLAATLAYDDSGTHLLSWCHAGYTSEVVRVLSMWVSLLPACDPRTLEYSLHAWGPILAAPAALPLRSLRIDVTALPGKQVRRGGTSLPAAGLPAVSGSPGPLSLTVAEAMLLVVSGLRHPSFAKLRSAVTTFARGPAFALFDASRQPFLAARVRGGTTSTATLDAVFAVAASGMTEDVIQGAAAAACDFYGLS